MGRPTYVGPSGAGQLSKLANQAIVGVTIGVVAEAMLFVKKVEPIGAMREALLVVLQIPQFCNSMVSA